MWRTAMARQSPSQKQRVNPKLSNVYAAKPDPIQAPQAPHPTNLNSPTARQNWLDFVWSPEASYTALYSSGRTVRGEKAIMDKQGLSGEAPTFQSYSLACNLLASPWNRLIMTNWKEKKRRWLQSPRFLWLPQAFLPKRLTCKESWGAFWNCPCLEIAVWQRWQMQG